MVCADAGLHADETRRQVGEPCFHLAARPLLAQHDRATPIQTHDVKRVFADIDTDHGDFRIKAGSAACRGCRGSILAVVPWISIGAGGNPPLYLSYIALYANSICFVKSLLSNKGARQRWSPSLLLMQAKAGGLLASSIASLS